MSQKSSLDEWLTRLENWVVRLTELKMSARLTKAEKIVIDQLVEDLRALCRRLRPNMDRSVVRKLVFRAMDAAVRTMCRLFG